MEFDKTYDNEQHRLALIRMIVRKTMDERGLKTYKDYAKYINASPQTIGKLLNGKTPLTNRWINLILFSAGFNIDDLNKEFINRDLDEYINGKGHVIIDGVNYGRFDK